MEKNTDILMITFNRPHYLRRTLPALLKSCGSSARIWVWQNGNDPETVETLQKYRNELFQFHHSKQNVGLTEPINWLLRNAEGKFLSKVDDDCIVPQGWNTRLLEAHNSEPRFGVIGCWHFSEDDFDLELARKKIRTFAGEHGLLINLWVGGSGFIMKRTCFEKFGLLQEGQTFTDYCIQIGRAGWVNGWLYPLILQEHLDDPRARHSGLRTDQEFEKFEPLSAKLSDAHNVDAWLAQLRKSARYVQVAPIEPSYWSPTRRRLRNLQKRLGVMNRNRQVG